MSNKMVTIPYTFIFLSFIMSILQLTVSELRFCYKGPHTIRENVCPGGFIAFQPLNFSCLYYRKGPDISDITVRVLSKECKEETIMNSEGEDGSIQIEGFSRVMFESFNEAGEPKPGKEIDETICADAACLTEWRNLAEPEDEPMLIEKPPIPDDQLAVYQKRYSTVAKELFMELMRTEEPDEVDHFEPDLSEVILPNLLEVKNSQVEPRTLNMLELFALTMKITSSKCGPFVEGEYLEQVMKGMIFLNRKVGTHLFVEIDSIPFRRIFHHLKRCQKATNNLFLLNGTECGNVYKLDTIVDLSNGEKAWKYRRQARSFRWGFYDPLIESAWAAVDFVHGYCFQSFHSPEDILHFHLYISAMEALFPPEVVQAHWMYPVKLKKDDEFWNTIMDTEDIKNQLRSLDGCAIAAYLGKAPFQERLLRPFVREEQMEDPQYEANPEEQRGWRRSTSEYWNFYEKQGGFKEISRNFGYCLDGSIENLEAVEAELKERGLQSCEQA